MDLDKITYEINPSLSVSEFIDVLKASGPAERRPFEDQKCISGMLENANLLITAKPGNKIVGVARIDYYPKTGLKKHDQARVLDENDQIK